MSDEFELARMEVPLSAPLAGDAQTLSIAELLPTQAIAIPLAARTGIR